MTQPTQRRRQPLRTYVFELVRAVAMREISAGQLHSTVLDDIRDAIADVSQVTAERGLQVGVPAAISLVERALRDGVESLIDWLRPRAPNRERAKVAEEFMRFGRGEERK